MNKNFTYYNPWTMRMSFQLTALLVLMTSLTLQAQFQKPKDMFEVGANAGAFFVAGEIDPEPKLGYSLHVRKSTDYLFSLRGDVMFAKASGLGKDNSDQWSFESDWFSASGLGIFSLNGIRADRPRKKMNIYAMVGGGINSFESSFKTPGLSGHGPRQGTIDRETAFHAIMGAGWAFRLSPRINIGLEYQVFGLFGQRSDLVDGINRESNVRSAFNDVPQWASLQVNYNIGNASNKSEPLYWATLGQDIMESIDEIKRDQATAFADTDQDGVFDAIDQEPNTPADAPVDTKGRTLDSDKDGVADYKDLEPYYRPRADERVNEDGVVINPIAPAGGVTEDRVKEMIDEALREHGINTEGGQGAVTEWFLPMIHFGLDSYTIKYSDYGTLASVARMMKSNKNMRLAVVGHTDQTGNESSNQNLSYQRANAVIDHLVREHGIGRGRFVLLWKGQGAALVPQSASYMNRRVELRAATSSDVEMDPPSSDSSTDDGY